MAWQAEIVSREQVISPNGAALQLDVRYYDDANPTTTLATYRFVFDGEDNTLASIRNAVIAKGQSERSAFSRVESAMGMAQLAPGITVAIP